MEKSTPILIFDRYKTNIPKEQCKIIKEILKKYVLGIVISRSSGDVLYNFQVDPGIRVDLISQFIAALALFGEENVGQINRIFIGGLNIELSIIQRNELILTTFFRPNMVKNYLEEEAIKGLDLFYKKFKIPLEQKKSNQAIYESFDEEICHIITEYLKKIGVLKEKDLR
ncbi:hypothetical protein [Candidatus Harpocratesius sp.]